MESKEIIVIGLKKLEDEFKPIVSPWNDTGNSLTNIQCTGIKELNAFKLIKISEISVSEKIEDKNKFIQDKFQNIYKAAYDSNITLATVYRGTKKGVEIYIGVLSRDGRAVNILSKIANGVFPGLGSDTKKSLNYDGDLNLDQFFKDCKFYSSVSLIPVTEIKDEKQSYDISSVIKSSYGSEYIYCVISKPVPAKIVAEKLNKIYGVKDKIHTLAKQNISKEKGKTTGETFDEGYNTLKSKSKTESKRTRSFNFMLFGIGWGTNKPGVSTTEAETEGWSLNYSVSNQVQESESISHEIINSFLIDSEKIADIFISRYKKGINIGFWESSYLFSSDDKSTLDILTGSFLGELLKPNEDISPYIKISGEIIDDKLPIGDIYDDNLKSPFANFITTQELSMITSPPAESLPGFEIRNVPELSLNYTHLSGDSGKSVGIGNVVDQNMELEGYAVDLSYRDLSKHLFIAGATGSGKTNTVKNIIQNFEDIPYLVVESVKSEYKSLCGYYIDKNKIPRIYSLGKSSVCPFQLNPFYVLPNTNVSTHIDYLKALFMASFSLYGPMPHILEKCLYNVYQKKGWSLTLGTHPFFEEGNDILKRYDIPEHIYCFPTLDDLVNEIDYYVKHKLDYKGELSDNIRTALVTRLESLSVGSKGFILNTNQIFPDFDSLFGKNIILELEALSDDDDKALIVGLILIFLTEYRRNKHMLLNGPDRSESTDEILKHLLIIEEAHRLLKNVSTEKSTEMIGNPKGNAVETFCNMLSEIRAYGQGIIVVEQIPTKIAPDVIKNSNTKIIHRLVSAEDQKYIAGAIGLKEEESLYLNNLISGYALCHKEGMGKPVEIKMKYLDSDSNNLFNLISLNAIEEYRHFNLYSFKDYLLTQDSPIRNRIYIRVLATRFVNSLLTEGKGSTKYLIERLLDDVNRLMLKSGMSGINNSQSEILIINEIMNLFSQGLYSVKNAPPEGLLNLLAGLFKEKKGYLAEKFISCIREYWGCKNKEELVDYLNNLLIKFIMIYLYKTKSKESKENKLSNLPIIIKNCFLRCDDKSVDKIIKQIL